MKEKEPHPSGKDTESVTRRDFVLVVMRGDPDSGMRFAPYRSRPIDSVKSLKSAVRVLNR